MNGKTCLLVREDQTLNILIQQLEVNSYDLRNEGGLARSLLENPFSNHCLKIQSAMTDNYIKASGVCRRPITCFFIKNMYNSFLWETAVCSSPL